MFCCFRIIFRKKIQQGDDGHDSTEDAKATMDLVLLKLYKGNIVFIHSCLISNLKIDF